MAAIARVSMLAASAWVLPAMCSVRLAPTRAVEAMFGHEPCTAPAKGRVERANSTLQDRLVKELRLAGVSSIKAGNAFLEPFRRDYNARFGHAPLSDHDAHRELLKAERARVDAVFCWQESRAVSRALTLQYDKVIYWS